MSILSALRAEVYALRRRLVVELESGHDLEALRIENEIDHLACKLDWYEDKPERVERGGGIVDVPSCVLCGDRIAKGKHAFYVADLYFCPDCHDDPHERKLDEAAIEAEWRLDS